MNERPTFRSRRRAGTIDQCLFAGLALCVTVAGCAHRASEPVNVAHQFAGAVAARNWDGAYRLMSGAYRRRVPLATFRAELQAEAATVSADVALLSRLSEAAPARAEIHTPNGQRLLLVWEADGWRLDAHPLQLFAQDSPRAALQTFVRAVEGRRYDILLRLIPARRRVGVDVVVLRAYWEGPESAPRRTLISRLRTNREAPIVDLGTEAYMPFGSPGPAGGDDIEGEVHFVKEEGVWKIDDVR